MVNNTAFAVHATMFIFWTLLTLLLFANVVEYYIDELQNANLKLPISLLENRIITSFWTALF